MSYTDEYKKAKESGALRQITAEYHEWKKEKDFIIGRFVHVNTVPGKRSDTVYNQYLFETDNGLIKFALGGATDNEAGAMMRKGEVYRVEFKGTEALGGGRRVNKFFIECLTDAGGGQVGGPEDEPWN